MLCMMIWRARPIIVNILNFLIYKEKKTLDQIKSPIATFDYGKIEDKNKPRSLTEDCCTDSVTGENKSVVCKQSATEMLGLIRYEGLKIVDFIPWNNKYWHGYRIFRKK